VCGGRAKGHGLTWQHDTDRNAASSERGIPRMSSAARFNSQDAEIVGIGDEARPRMASLAWSKSLVSDPGSRDAGLSLSRSDCGHGLSRAW